MNDAMRPASKPAMFDHRQGSPSPSAPPLGRRVLTVALCALAALILGVLAPGPVRADATVTVELKAGGRPAAGVVTLTASAGGRTFSCRAPANTGVCSIPGVPGGMYTVTVAPAQGAPPRPRTAMIPPSGTARLIVAAH